MRTLTFTLSLLLIGTCQPYDAFSQANLSNLISYKDTVDVIRGNFKSDNLKITKRQAEDTAEYGSFVRRFAGQQRDLWPYYPYVLINPTYLPKGPIRIYPGKLIEGGNDYVLVVVQSKKYQGKPRKGQIIHYVDDSSDTSVKPSGIKKKNDWFSVRLGRTSTLNDSVFYSKITKEVARKYIENFSSRNRLNLLENRYKHCFVVESTRNIRGRLILQPIVKSVRRRQAARADSSRTIRARAFTDNQVIEFQGNNVCCQSPPEGGAAVQP